jgi:hypothetical protein
MLKKSGISNAKPHPPSPSPPVEKERYSRISPNNISFHFNFGINPN